MLRDPAVRSRCRDPWLTLFRATLGQGRRPDDVWGYSTPAYRPEVCFQMQAAVKDDRGVANDPKLPSSNPSVDHLVGLQEQRRRHLDAKDVCRLQIDHELELARLHDGEFGWLLAFEDASDIDTDLPI
jgi:hypothetical protein